MYALVRTLYKLQSDAQPYAIHAKCIATANCLYELHTDLDMDDPVRLVPVLVLCLLLDNLSLHQWLHHGDCH